MLVLPAPVPSMSFARRERRNDPCVQSWKTMNVRSRKPAAGTTSRSDSSHDTCSASTIAAISTRYGTTDVATSTRLRASRGLAYASSAPRQERGESEPVNEAPRSLRPLCPTRVALGKSLPYDDGVRRAAAALVLIAALAAGAAGALADPSSDALVHADLAHDLGYSGTGVTVAVLDTGIDDHLPELSNAVVGEHCILPPSGCAGDTAEADGPGTAQDDQGHGTEVASILIGVAPRVKLVVVKVADRDGRSSSAQIQAGLDWLRVVHPEAHIVNVSLAGDIPLSGNCSNLTPALASYSASVRALRAQGTLVFAASGNNGRPNGLPAPACFPESVAVGAVYARTWGPVTAPNICRDAHPIADEVACWSNASSMLDLLAPGAPIETTSLGGSTTTFAGTSAAVAVAAGAASLLLQASPGLTADELETLLEQTGVLLVDPRRRASIPRVDLASALAQLLGHSLTHPRPPRVDISQ